MCSVLILVVSIFVLLLARIDSRSGQYLLDQRVYNREWRHVCLMLLALCMQLWLHGIGWRCMTESVNVNKVARQ
jgi:hypothetical protein